MARETFDSPTNPYHYALHCIGGKWKMTILHEIYTWGKIHFNQTLKVLPISEKMLSQQLKELIEDGLVQRIVKAYAEYENKKGKGKPAAKPAGKRLPTRRKEGK